MSRLSLMHSSVFAVSIAPVEGATGANATFRGVLIQTRPLLDDNQLVGTFTVVDADNSRLSSCSPNEVSIHNYKY